VTFISRRIWEALKIALTPFRCLQAAYGDVPLREDLRRLHQYVA
jgi:hypothetical protein